MNAATAATATPGSTGLIAHVSDKPVYIAPAAHQFLIAPAGRVIIPFQEKSAGIGIHADHHS
jgi:hypothetical protein